MNTNKETMNTNKDIINKLKHLSVPMGLYTIPKHQANYKNKKENEMEKERGNIGVLNVSILNSLETSEVIADEIFEKMLDITTVHDKTKTRKNKKYLQSNYGDGDDVVDSNTETDSSRKKEKRERKKTKKQRKSVVKGRRVTKKARK